MPSAFVTIEPMTIAAFAELAAEHGYQPCPGAEHRDLSDMEGMLFRAPGRRDIPVWETICRDRLAHVETYRPPEFFPAYHTDGDGEYGWFKGYYDDDGEEEEEVATL